MNKNLEKEKPLTRDEYFSGFKELMTTPMFTIKDTGLSYRTISNWGERGLMDEFKKEKEKWQRFDWIGLVKMKIYAELRVMGVSIDKLKWLGEILSRDVTKRSKFEDIFPDGFFDENFRSSVLVNNVIRSIMVERNTYLVCDSNFKKVSIGSSIDLAHSVLSSMDAETSFFKPKTNSFVVISLRRILLEIVEAKGSNLFQSQNDRDLSTLIEMVKSREKGSVDVNFDGGFISSMKATEYSKYDPNEKSLHEIVKSHKNQATTFHVNDDGKITTVKHNRKIK